MDRLVIDIAEAAGPWGVAFATMFGLIWWFFGDLHRQSGRDWWLSHIEQNDAAQLYRVLLERALVFIDQRLKLLAGNVEGSSQRDKTWRAGLLELCIGLALVYPSICVLGVAAFTGTGSWLGGTELFPDLSHDSEQRQTVIILFIGVCLYIFARSSMLLALNAYVVGVIGLAGTVFALIGLGLAYSSLLSQSETAAGFIILLALTLILLRFRALLWWWKWLAIILCGPGLYLLLHWWVGEDQLLGHFAGTGLSKTWVSGAIFGIGWLGGLGFWFILKMFPRFLTDVLLILSFFVFICLWAWDAATWSPFLNLFFVFGLLPVINAFADFVSIATTRFILWRGLKTRLAIAVGVDLAATIAIRALLGAVTIILVSLVETRTESPSVLRDYANDFLSDGGGLSIYTWLYACLFTTAIPTVLNLGLALFSASATLAQKVGWKLTTGLRSEIDVFARLSSFAFVFVLTMAIWAPTFLIWQAVNFTGPVLIGAILDFWEWATTLLMN